MRLFLRPLFSSRFYESLTYRTKLLNSVTNVKTIETGLPNFSQLN